MRHLIFGLLTVAVTTSPALADDYDLLRRAPGWWEMKVGQLGAPAGEMVTSQVCVDEAFDRLTWDSGRRQCSSFKVAQAGDTVVIDSVCSPAGFAQKQHSVISGDRSKAFRIEIASEPAGPVPAGLPKELSAPGSIVQTQTLIGPCPAGRKPGEAMIMGRVVNMRAMMERLMK